MRQTLDWIRANVIIVISVVVFAVALGLLGYVHMRGGSFIERVSGRSASLTSIRALEKTQVKIPPEKPDEPPRNYSIAVNQVAIDALKEAYEGMNREYADIYKFAVGVNQQGHGVLIDGLFPEPAVAPTLSFNARFTYQAVFPKFLARYSPAAEYPQIDARPAPQKQEIQAVIDRVEAEYRAANPIPAGGAQGGQFNEAQVREVEELKQKRWRSFVMGYAEGIHIYAQTDPKAPDFPFRLMSWATANTQPDPKDLWEAQMQIWIIQDLVRAIGLTNRVDQPKANVMNAPIKRLISVDISTDYVGITGRGAVDRNNPSDTGSGPAFTPTAVPQPGAIGPNAPGAPGGFGAPGAPGAPAGPGRPFGTPGAINAPSRAAVAAPTAGRKLPDDFAISPTGRRGNEIYDVRHAWLTMIVDSQRIPEFFDNLAKVNFMTVLKMDVADVDEYEEAKLGYIYGPGDAVKINLLVETLWLRDWTARLMPQVVRDMLGVVAPAAPAAPGPQAAAN